MNDLPEVTVYRSRARRRARRWAVAVAVVAIAVVAAGASVLAFRLVSGGGPDASGPPTLPRGDRTIFPKYRVVAYYGIGGTGQLGVLGATDPDAAFQRLQQQAEPYAVYGKPLMPAFELITTEATAAPGPDGDYSSGVPFGMVSQYLAAAKRHDALLVLDFQPGRATFLDQLKTYATFLEDPDVSVALDPEWRMDPDQIPGRVFGHTTAAEVNAAGAFLSGIVSAGDLPQKLLLVHQFRASMIRGRDQIQQWPGLAETISIDGQGPNSEKLRTYAALTPPPGSGFYPGFKVFYRADPDPMSPAQVMELNPQPVFVSYQ